MYGSGRRAPNMSEFINNLNNPTAVPQENEDITLFATNDFFDYDMGTGVGPFDRQRDNAQRNNSVASWNESNGDFNFGKSNAFARGLSDLPGTSASLFSQYPPLLAAKFVRRPSLLGSKARMTCSLHLVTLWGAGFHAKSRAHAITRDFGSKPH
jgi:hypothetical protein